MRITISMAIASAMLLSLGACSSDNQSSAPQDSSGAADSIDLPPDEPDFQTGMASYAAAAEDASERCGVLAAFMEAPAADPSSPAETAEAIHTTELLLTKMASNTDDTENANQLRSSAEALSAYAAGVDYDTELVDIGGNGPDIPAMDDFRLSVGAWVTEAHTDCSDQLSKDGPQ